MESHRRIGVEAPEPPPADLDGAEAAKDKAWRRNQSSMRRTCRVGLIRPQRIVVAYAFGEPQDCQARRIFVVDARFGTQLGANERAHLGEHFIGELTPSELLVDSRRVAHRLTPVFIITNY